MTTDLALVKKIVDAPLEEWTEDRIGLAVRSVCIGATPDEAAVFLWRCRALRMDPIARQIFFLKDKAGRVSHIVGIDGLRLVAQRTGQFEGRVGPQWQEKPGAPWLDSPPENEQQSPPHAARVGVWRTGFREPIFATVTFKSFARDSSAWKTYPSHMLGVRAESHALRAAFPAETSDLTVTFDDDGEARIPIANPDAKASNEMLAWLAIHADEHGWSKDDRHDIATDILGREVTTFSDLTKGEADRLRRAWEGSDIEDGVIVEDETQDSSGLDEAAAAVDTDTTPEELSEPEAEPAQVVSPDATAEVPPPVGPQEASGSEPLDEFPDFPFIGGKYPGKTCAWVAIKDRPYLESILEKLELKNRPTAEFWLRETAGGE